MYGHESCSLCGIDFRSGENMKLLESLVTGAAVLALAGAAQADTRNSNKDKATMEQKASPAAPRSDEERAEASQGQPDVPHPGGTSRRNTTKQSTEKAKPSGSSAKEKSKDGASTGSSAVQPGAAAPGFDLGQAFKLADIDGDGAVSKAEAAGNERLVKGFDRADKDRDGKLSRSEYESIFNAKSRSTARAAAR
jgi:hypothetical protein